MAPSSCDPMAEAAGPPARHPPAPSPTRCHPPQMSPTPLAVVALGRIGEFGVSPGVPRRGQRHLCSPELAVLPMRPLGRAGHVKYAPSPLPPGGSDSGAGQPGWHRRPPPRGPGLGGTEPPRYPRTAPPEPAVTAVTLRGLLPGAIPRHPLDVPGWGKRKIGKIGMGTAVPHRGQSPPLLPGYPQVTPRWPRRDPAVSPPASPVCQRPGATSTGPEPCPAPLPEPTKGIRCPRARHGSQRGPGGAAGAIG